MRRWKAPAASATLSGLLDGIPHLVNIEHYIEIIRDKSLLRQMINSANKIMAECFDQAEPADAILDRAEQALVQSVGESDEGRIRFRAGHGGATPRSC